MFQLKVKIDNVSLRSFLYLLDQGNLKKELSNTTICDYIIETFGETFTGRYKDLKSFRSGYAGNLSLIFDSYESQYGNLNKFTKILEPILVNVFMELRAAKVYFDNDFCVIENIPDESIYRLLCVFFNLKPINSLINRKINLANPQNGWLSILCNKFNLDFSELMPHPSMETGRGRKGSKSILNRYTIYNFGQNWFDVIKPYYYNFSNLRYKIFLHSLLIEQENLYYCFVKSKKYDFDYNVIFQKAITVKSNEPKLDSDYLNELISFEELLVVKKNDIKEVILSNVELPKNFQFMFTLIDNSLVFSDGTILDLNPYLIDDYSVLERSRSINPNITFDTVQEKTFKENVTQGLSSTVNINKRLKRLAINGEESHTVMKFIDKSYKGLIKVFDYLRDKENTIITGKEKTCLILYNGTKYPDLVCIFLEDAVKIKKQGLLSISEYSSDIWNDYKQFKHLFFEVEAEYNLTSFKSHDKYLNTVLRSKYIFCENMNDNFYKSKFGISIPVLSIKDL